MNKTELETTAILENLPVITEFISTAMRKFNLKQDIPDVLLSVDEVCTNIIKYGYTGKTGMINIVCELTDNDLMVTITDKGKPFDPTTAPPPDLSPEWKTRRIGGLGIYLVKTLMDDVNYRYDNNIGNILTLRKRIKIG
jgi:serine/threonine-protein kinase RsbW